MNIFFTDKSPIKSAKYLDTKRVNKMILESCQMLSTAVIQNGGQAPYKSTHKNHPSTLWATHSYENWTWLWNHMVALALEYKKRRGKVHKSFLKFINSDIKLQAKKHIPSKGLTKKPNCAANQQFNVSYKHVENVYEAYKLYLNDRWDTDKLTPVWE